MKIIDLSHPIYDKMSTYPTDPDVSIIREKDISTDRSLLHRITMGTHTGTHLDAPAHIIPKGKTLDKFPLNTFLGRTMKVDHNSYISLEQVDENIDGIIYETGWYKHFNEPDIYYGSHRPVISNNIVEMVKRMGINFFGCDLPSVDASGAKDKLVHNSLLGADIIVYESLTNLDHLPLLISFDFYGFPLSLNGLDGSPVRAVGILN